MAKSENRVKMSKSRNRGKMTRTTTTFDMTKCEFFLDIWVVLKRTVWGVALKTDVLLSRDVHNRSWPRRPGIDDVRDVF